jgi:hypothetical protein
MVAASPPAVLRGPVSASADDRDPRFDDVEAKPAPAHFRPPVPWLLAPELLGAIKRIVMYALYKGDFDARDWMSAACADTDEAARAGDPDELWFDYLADIGDGQTAMYTAAFLCQDDAYLDGDGVTVRTPSAIGAAPAGATVLRRGQFLFLGGDTAYHVADYATLNERVRKPFVWAHRDIVAARAGHGLPPRTTTARLYGIPGNHDYYDQLVGFNRLFRKPVTDERAGGPLPPRLPLPGFERAQDTSYVAIGLPFGWQLWGIDCARRLDFRQRSYFEERAARRLVVATPTPAAALGRITISAQHRDALTRLGLGVPRAEGPAPAPVRADLDAGRALDCRLDLSGDIHHYARHGGAAPGEPPARYASVQAGGGGAFHQPSFVDAGQVRRDAVYPDAATSRRAIAGRLLDPFTIVRGGFVRALGIVVALIVFDASVHGNVAWLFDTLLRAIGVERERPWGASLSTVARALGHGFPGKLGASLGFFCLLLAAGVLWVLAARIARWVLVNQRRPVPSAAYRWYRRGPFVIDPYMPAWALFCAGVALPLAAPYLIREFPPADVLFRDLTFLAAALLVVVGLVGLALSTGADERGPLATAGFAALGATHAVLQLALPFLLVRVALAATPGLALVALTCAVATVLGWALLRRGMRWPVVAVWLGRSLAVVVLALRFSEGVAVAPTGGLGDLALYAIAGAAGMVVACLEFGWYLAVASAFSGHVVETGAAARIEGYKQMVRFRLTREGLTGYVIAVDHPVSDGPAIAARVVDVFTVSPPPR